MSTPGTPAGPETVEPAAAEYTATHAVFRVHFQAATPAEAPVWLQDSLSSAARSHASIDQTLQQLKTLQQAGAVQLSVVENDMKSLLEKGRMEQDQAIAELRTEVQDLKSEVWEFRRTAHDGSRSGSGGNRGRKATFDDRKLKITAYGGDRRSWKDYSWTLQTFVGREAPEIRAAMIRAVREDTEIKNEHLADYGVDPDIDQELAWLLLNHTEVGSKAKGLLRVQQLKPGLEQYRQLNRDARPKGGAQETLTYQGLIHPPKAKSYDDFRRLMVAWDTALLEEEMMQDGADVLTDRTKAMALLWMMPATSSAKSSRSRS